MKSRSWHESFVDGEDHIIEWWQIENKTKREVGQAS